MLDNFEIENESTSSEVLCGKSDKINMDLPTHDMTVTLNYAECEKASRQKENTGTNNNLGNLTQFLVIQNSSSALLKQKEKIEQELAVFKNCNQDLANDERFSDTYYFRLAEFYALSKNYEKEDEYLSKIHDKENKVYAAKIAENKLRKNEHTKENLAILYKANTSESSRKLSAFYIAQNDLAKAQDALLHYIEEHEDIPYDIYFQYAFVFMKKGDANNAIRYLKKSFYRQNTAQSALLISWIYIVLSIKDINLLKKALHWCNIAVYTDISFTPALRLFINMELESNPQKTETLLLRYMKLNTAKDHNFYFTAAINYAKCAFIKQKYGEALERLSPLTDDKTNPSAVWNNIALCNASLGKLERAEKQIAKSLEKFTEQSNSAKPSLQLQTILTNYMKILNRQGKYKETIALFKNTNGAKDFTLTEDSYLNYFSEWAKALKATGDYETFYNFLSPAFMYDSNNPTIKLFACNDLLRLLALTGARQKEMYGCLNFLKQIHKEYPKGRHTALVLNNIVFTSLELEEPLEEKIMQNFTSTLDRSPCNTATYGMYLLRIKHDIQKGQEYYTRAIEMSRKMSGYAFLTEELKLKKDIEAAREYIHTGDTKTARRLLESSYKRCTRIMQGYSKACTKLLQEC